MLGGPPTSSSPKSQRNRHDGSDHLSPTLISAIIDRSALQTAANCISPNATLPAVTTGAKSWSERRCMRGSRLLAVVDVGRRTYVAKSISCLAQGVSQHYACLLHANHHHSQSLTVDVMMPDLVSRLNITRLRSVKAAHDSVASNFFHVFVPRQPICTQTLFTWSGIADSSESNQHDISPVKRSDRKMERRFTYTGESRPKFIDEWESMYR